MNLLVLKKSSRRPKSGDVFVTLPPDDLFLYGRVISTEAKIGAMEGCILIYIYNVRSTTKLPIQQLSPTKLLLPPIMTNRLPWRRGYFETILQAPLNEGDKLKQHCFFSHFRKVYFDESNNRMNKAVEPIGNWGLDSFRTIDDEISKALGIPLSPD